MAEKHKILFRARIDVPSQQNQTQFTADSTEVLADSINDYADEN